MKKYINGKYIELTAEEIEQIENNKVETIPTAEERLEIIEQALLELGEVLSNG